MGNSLALQIPASVALLTKKRISLTDTREMSNNSERGGPSIPDWWRASGKRGRKVLLGEMSSCCWWDFNYVLALFFLRLD